MASFFSRRQSTPETASSPPDDVQVRAAGFDTVLGPGCSMEGHLSSSGNLRLDGSFSGTLDISGNVLVGETARIQADIHARNISIAGAVRGNVSGKKVQILRTGRVWGDISATALSTEEGAFIDGKITMLGRAVAAGEGVETDPDVVFGDKPAETTAAEETPLPAAETPAAETEEAAAEETELPTAEESTASAEPEEPEAKTQQDAADDEQAGDEDDDSRGGTLS